MDETRTLSGSDLVAKGISKNQATLPESGLKDTSPDGTWVESKKIQSSVEARRQLIGAHRIEKRATLSHAIWRENLKLAEVTHKTGGYWQFMGHNVGKQLFLYPEEAVFLVEINCLLLKYNDVIVSIQQAYSLIFNTKTSFMHYKVYATLSRWGYKVFRHQYTKNTLDSVSNSDENVNSSIHGEKDIDDLTNTSTEERIQENNNNSEMQITDELIRIDDKNTEDGNKKNNNSGTQITDEPIRIDVKSTVDGFNPGVIVRANEQMTDSEKIEDSLPATNIDCQNLTREVYKTIKRKSAYKRRVACRYQNQIEKINNRLYKPCDAKTVHSCFINLKNLFQAKTFSINVPEKTLIPNNICFSKTTYTLNIESIRTKALRPTQTESETYSSDEVNGVNIRRVENDIEPNGAYLRQSHRHIIFPRPFPKFAPWPTFVRTNYYHLNMTLQRPYLGNFFVTPRYQQIPRFRNYFSGPFYANQSHVFGNNLRRFRKRTNRYTKRITLESLKKLAARLKTFALSGNVPRDSLVALHRVIDAYNARYGTKLKLSNNYSIVENEIILETIELGDDDEQPKSKKPRLEASPDTYAINMNSIKQLARRLKELEKHNKSTGRHRRAFSNLIKTFNKSYNADIYMTSNFEVVDRSFIAIDNSSDSDCVVDETAHTSSGKKVRNPFNILKSISEKRNKSINEPGTSSEITDDYNRRIVKDYKYNDALLKNFTKNWLPAENDFGRAEIVTGELNNITSTDNFIYDYLKFDPVKYENWLDLKVSFLTCLRETTEVFQNGTELNSNTHRLSDSIVTPEDFTDIVSVLHKLSIIKSNNTKSETCSMVINYDVYHKDVQNFRKTNRPTPHFRISCLEDTEDFPTGDEIASLHAKYTDNVRIVIAVVGDGTIYFLQINPTTTNLSKDISINV